MTPAVHGYGENLWSLMMDMDRPGNALLRSLLPDDMARLAPHLQEIELGTGDILYEMESAADWVVLPETGLLSLITVLGSGSALETSIVGREGGVGFVETLGSGTMYSRVVVQVPGTANRVRAAEFRKAFDASAAMRTAVHCQIELLQAESRQAIACHGLHNVRQRFNRWLLECDELSGRPETMPLKQEFLAVMLGVSRPAVTRIAADAQECGFIRYTRGVVTIVDHAALEREACECRASLQYLRRKLEPESVLASAGH